MNLITYGGILLRRGGDLASDLACCCEPPECCDLPNNVEVTLTLSDFSYSCSQLSEWSPDGGFTIFSDFESTIVLTGVSGAYSATTTYTDCVVGDFSMEIGEITFRIFARQKTRPATSSTITEHTSDQTWTGLLKLERIGGVTKFWLYDQVRTSATVLSTIGGVFHDDFPAPGSACLGANDSFEFHTEAPCDNPTDFSAYMNVIENMPRCETEIVDGEYVFIFIPGISDVGFTLPDVTFGARGVAFGGGVSDNHVGLYTQSPDCLHPLSFSPFGAGTHLWVDSLEYEIVESA